MIPTLVHQVELSEPLTDARSKDHQAVRVLVRLHGMPVGFVNLGLDEGVLSAAALQRGIDNQLDVTSHLARDGIRTTADAGTVWACHAGGPHPVPSPVSVVLCTRDREDQLRTALTSVIAALGPDDEVVVVDNAPKTGATRKVVDGFADPRLRYVLEPRPGLSIARNTGARAANGDFLAFTDDDVVVDAGWLSGLARGFTRAPNVGCVTGLVPSAELDTDAQHFFDRKVSWSSSTTARLFDLEDHRDAGPLYPYSAGVFGTGANFAVSRKALEAIGSFDEALGAGALTKGGEDLDWFVRTLQHGYAVAYEPGAIVWHRHRRDLEALTEQLYGYGTGLTAFLVKHLMTRHGFPEISRRFFTGTRMMGSSHTEFTALGIDRAVLRRELVGMVHGPLLYARARWRLRHAR